MIHGADGRLPPPRALLSLEKKQIASMANFARSSRAYLKESVARLPQDRHGWDGENLNIALKLAYEFVLRVRPDGVSVMSQWDRWAHQ